MAKEEPNYEDYPIEEVPAFPKVADMQKKRYVYKNTRNGYWSIAVPRFGTCPKCSEEIPLGSKFTSLKEFSDVQKYVDANKKMLETNRKKREEEIKKKRIEATETKLKKLKEN